MSLVFIQLTSCDEQNINKNNYCSEMSSELCRKLFEEKCNGYEFKKSLRYKSESECQSIEQNYCKNFLQANESLFNIDMANSCVDEIKKSSCEQLGRSAFHNCNEVFPEIETN